MFRLVPSAAGRRIAADVTGWARARAHCAIRYDENASGAWFQTLLDELRSTRERVHFIRLSPEPDRIEREREDFFERVRGVYLARAAAEPARFRVIDASQPVEAVRAAVCAALVDWLRDR